MQEHYVNGHGTIQDSTNMVGNFNTHFKLIAALHYNFLQHTTHGKFIGTFTGLKYHDILYDSPEVEEALRRLPQAKVDERNFRIVRAMQCSLNKVYLPKDQWMTYEKVM